MAGNNFKIPSWIAFWLAFSAVICTMDALFVILRPRTLPGGNLNYLFQYYNPYVEIDFRYKDLKDSFVIGQSWMNLVEVFINIIALILNTRASSLSLIVALVVSTMTCAKTVLYFLLSSKLCNGGQFLAQTSWLKLLFIFVIPNGTWIVVPLFCIVTLIRKIQHAMDGNVSKPKKR